MKGTAREDGEGFAARFTAEDFWFTAKKGNVYVNAFTRPVNGPVRIKTLAKNNPASNSLVVRSVRLLGYEGTLKWRQNESALEIDWPKGLAPDYGYWAEVSPQR